MNKQTITTSASDPPSGHDLSKEKVLYAVAYAHLDTQWRWDYTATINKFLKNTLEKNFELFEKHPDYVFSFTGARRYAFIKEYYPEQYEKLRRFIRQGRWFVAGSSVDEGDVTISSAESVIRQILYGNEYFRNEFGVESVDYMLPDCFGFPASIPSVWAHCGLRGFSTNKLTWGCAVEMPFSIGVWEGPDGRSVIAALNAGPQDLWPMAIKGPVGRNPEWTDRIEENGSQHGVYADYHYYGDGDRGGSPREEDVENYLASANDADSPILVALASSDQMFKDITDSQRKRLPRYQGDLLLTEHSAGSLTSQAYMKRWNRKNEQLADAAERAAVTADWLGGYDYPREKLNRSWWLVLGSQMHDILPGTSLPRANEYSWNDEIVALNGFASVLSDAVGAVSRVLDTHVIGKAVVVYNALAVEWQDVVEAQLLYPEGAPENVEVYDPDGESAPCQVVRRDANLIQFLFLAKVPAVGFACFDVRPAEKESTGSNSLLITDTFLENDYYRVTIDANGDVTSIHDKTVQREMLSAPARLEFLRENPSYCPAWNMDWSDRRNPPFAYVEGPAEILIQERGPVRVSLEIRRESRNSIFTQEIRLASGDAGRRVEFKNVIDWQSRGCSLKAAFPLTVNSSVATYNLMLGTIDRNTNHPKKYEVPSHEWFDLNDGEYGVSVLEDSKFGSDKPDDHTLRLTLLYTPKGQQGRGVGKYADQSTQDWGRHDILYALYGHAGDWRVGRSEWQGRELNQPLMAFHVPAHSGALGKSFSMFEVSTPQVDMRAFKQAENGESIIIRLQELWGRNCSGFVTSSVAGIVAAYEVDGQERQISAAAIRDGKLCFDMTPYSLRSYAIQLDTAPIELDKLHSVPVAIDFGADAANCQMDETGYSLPAEMLPETITSEGVSFFLGESAADRPRVLSCQGQTLQLPEGKFNRLYLLAAATEDTKGLFTVGDSRQELSVQCWTGFVGQFDNRVWDREFEEIDYDCEGEVIGLETGYIKRDNIAWFCTHRIKPDGSKDAYQFSYLYKYAFDLPDHVGIVVLPRNPAIKLLAMTAAWNENDLIEPTHPLYDDFTNRQPVKLRESQPT